MFLPQIPEASPVVVDEAEITVDETELRHPGQLPESLEVQIVIRRLTDSPVAENRFDKHVPAVADGIVHGGLDPGLDPPPDLEHDVSDQLMLVEDIGLSGVGEERETLFLRPVRKVIFLDKSLDDRFIGTVQAREFRVIRDHQGIVLEPESKGPRLTRMVQRAQSPVQPI